MPPIQHFQWGRAGERAGLLSFVYLPGMSMPAMLGQSLFQLWANWFNFGRKAVFVLWLLK